MARKAKTDESKVLKVTEIEMLSLQNAMLRGEAARLRAESLRVSRAALLARIDPENQLNKLDTQISLLVAADGQALQEFNAIRDAIGTRLGVNIDRAAIDPLSGEVVIEAGEPPPEG